MYIYISVNYIICIYIHISLHLSISPFILGIFFQSFSFAYLNGKAHLLSLTFGSSMIRLQISCQAYLLPVLASCSSTIHSRPDLPENVSSLEAIQAQSTTVISSAFYLSQIPFSHFPSPISSYPSLFQTPRPGSNIRVCGTLPTFSFPTLTAARSQSVLPLCSDTGPGPLL